MSQVDLDTYFGTAEARMLFHNVYELRINDSLIGGHKAEAVYPSGRDNDPVVGIAQRIAHSVYFGSYLDIHRHHVEAGTGFEGLENFADWCSKPSAGYHRDLDQRDCTQREGF
jgi:hypothetical protein